jgi:hypothetical protein
MLSNIKKQQFTYRYSYFCTTFINTDILWDDFNVDIFNFVNVISQVPVSDIL